MNFKTICLFKLRALIIAGLSWFPSLAQQISWERQFGLSPYDEVIDQVTPSSDGNYFALGSSRKFEFNLGNQTYPGAVLIKFTPNGDTLFLKNLNTAYNSSAYLGYKFGDIYRAVISTPVIIGAGIAYLPTVVEFTGEGQVTYNHSFILENYPNIKSCISAPDQSLFLCGYASGGAAGGVNMIGCKINFMNEVEWLIQYLPPVTIIGRGELIEPATGKGSIISGPMGKRIYEFEIDSLGVLIDQKKIYETPSNRTFMSGAALQTWNKGSVSFGYYIDGTNTAIGYFGRHDSLGNKLWGGELSKTIVRKVAVNREMSFLVSTYDGEESSFSRIDKDSNTLWNINFSTSQPFDSDKHILGLTFTEPDTCIAFGFYRQQGGNLGYQFYLAKIGGVGTRFDPTNPSDTVTTSIEAIFKPNDSPVLFPNPAHEFIRFQKLTQEAILSIYSLKGEKLFTRNLKPEETVPVSALPHGAYLYHLKMGERVFTGKFLKN